MCTKLKCGKHSTDSHGQRDREEEEMKDKTKLMFLALAIALMLCSLASLPISAIEARKKGDTKRVLLRYPYEEYLPDNYTAEAANFEDYPADFSEGTVAWDLDLIDAEPGKTSYDGEGIYVAVLDTGLIANWRDYFPEERIAVEYGMGFYENVRRGPNYITARM